MAAAANRFLSLIASACTALYVAWTAFSLARRVPPLAETFNALGAQLPLPTRTALSLCSPPILWGTAAILIAALVLKEFFTESLSTRVLVTVVIFMATALASALITEALFSPLFDLIRRIG